jgi:hypothetical protein
MNRRSVVVIACVLPGAAAASSTAVRCPDSVSVEQRATAVENGWESGADAVPHRLARVTFFAGPPAQRASLVPSDKPGGKQRTMATWDLPAGESYWLSCGYARTNVVLSRRLPAEIRSCTVTYANDVRIDGMPQIVKLECR